MNVDTTRTCIVLSASRLSLQQPSVDLNQDIILFTNHRARAQTKMIRCSMFLFSAQKIAVVVFKHIDIQVRFYYVQHYMCEQQYVWHLIF